MTRAAVIGCAALLAMACRPAAPVPAASPEPEPAPPPSTRVAGEVLESTIPLFDGGAVDLASLRGKVVVLELSSGSSPHFEPADEYYRAVLERHDADTVAVIRVAIDAETQQLQRVWDRSPPPYVLGWDPQGALAARLQITAIPTTFVLDVEGRIVTVIGGYAPDDVDRGIAEAMSVPTTAPAVAPASPGSR